MLRALRISLRADKCPLPNLRCSSLITAGLFSGFIYRAYVSCNQPRPACQLGLLPPPHLLSALRPFLPRSSHLPAAHRFTLPLNVLFADEDSPHPSPEEVKALKEAQVRLDRLIAIQQWIENELPSVFFRGLFSSLDIFQPATVLEIERPNGKWMLFSGPTRANCFLAVVRSYFAAVSSGRRIDVLNIRVDQNAWTVESSFRVVLLPSPTREERGLPFDQLLQRLEPRAKWHEFRATFQVNKSGDLVRLKITRLNRSSKRFIEIPLHKVSLVGQIVPALTCNTRQIPQSLSVLTSSSSRKDDVLLQQLRELQKAFEDISKRGGFLGHVDHAGDCLDLLLAASKIATTQNRSASSPSMTPKPNSHRRKPQAFLDACPYIMALLSSCAQSLV